ncbi:hypothetical protein CN198_12120 [Sinorhizobium meliloti]|nr:hypothetical protein CN198_12120 [Sinorhizobium meliloti]RVK67809.1 hypothetical protein CN159_15250 [Sinorhizobium meliloti]RVP15168.1 hypothetical protein CN085_12225 [Sinorhizobium meliloti]
MRLTIDANGLSRSGMAHERTYSQIDMDERRRIARWRSAGLSAPSSPRSPAAASCEAQAEACPTAPRPPLTPQS